MILNKAKKLLVCIFVAATIFTTAACSNKPTTPTTPVPTQPYSTLGTMASLGYGSDGKLVTVDVDKMGDELFDDESTQPKDLTFTATDVLKFDNYSALIGKGGAYGSLNFVAVYNSNSQLVGTVTNLGEETTATIVHDKNLGDLAVISWQAYGGTTENNIIGQAINAAEGYTGKDGPLIAIGPDWSVTQPTVSGKATDYVSKIEVYKIQESSLQEIACQPPLLRLNPSTDSLTTSYDGNGGTLLNITYSWEMPSGTRNSGSSQIKLEDLVGKGIVNANSPVTSLVGN
jgi:hypothetical protein